MFNFFCGNASILKRSNFGRADFFGRADLLLNNNFLCSRLQKKNAFILHVVHAV